MTTPMLRAELENGQTYDDPSEDPHFEILGDIDASEALSVIVERLDDPSRQPYAQALRDKDGTYILERRLGTPDTHEATRAPDMRSAHQLLNAWASNATEPQPLPLGSRSTTLDDATPRSVASRR